MFVSGFRFEAERLPLIAITDDRIKAKDKVHRIHARVIPYSDFRSCASSSAKRLYATVVSFPIPSIVENTSGVNTAYSTSLSCHHTLSSSPWHLVLSVECWDIGTSVARCVRVKNPNFKKCILLPTPESLLL